VAVGAERYVHDPRPHPRHILRGEAERGDGTGPIALHENVCVANEPGKRLARGRLAQIEMRRQLAAAGVDDERFHPRQMRRGDQQDIGAVHGEGAPAHRAGDDARQIEHLDAAKRAFGNREGLRRGIADLLDRQKRKLGDGVTLRMLIPLGERPAHRDHESGIGGRLLQRLGAPSIKRALHRGPLVGAVEQRKRPVAVMRQIGIRQLPIEIAWLSAALPIDIYPVSVPRTL
jgi:hypothetical protein